MLNSKLQRKRKQTQSSRNEPKAKRIHSENLHMDLSSTWCSLVSLLKGEWNVFFRSDSFLF
jgi:hypothetical protein